MKESAEIALSFVRSHAAELGIDPDAFVGKRFHLHVPAGAVPKDGPSAGVTMTSALVSLLTDVPVRTCVGMTGEVTLRGRVLPIGGVRQKVLAAHRSGLTEVVLPARNGPDLEDVPEEVREADDVPPRRAGRRRARPGDGASARSGPRDVPADAEGRLAGSPELPGPGPAGVGSPPAPRTRPAPSARAGAGPARRSRPAPARRPR